MKLTLQIQLLPDKQQAAQLKSTMERFNAACSWLCAAKVAWREVAEPRLTAVS